MNRFAQRFALSLPSMRPHSWIGQLNRDVGAIPRTSFIGQGFINNQPDYFLTHSILKNPKWHSAYAAYQAEISQGRLTMFNHYQNLITWITGKSCTNASSLDDCQAAVDAVNMFKRKHRMEDSDVVLQLDDLYPYREDALSYYANGLGWQVGTEGNIRIGQSVSHQTGNRNTEQTDILFFDPKLPLLGAEGTVWTERAEGMECEIAVGHLQNYGIPLSAGGPYLGFIATDRDYRRYIPGKVVIPAHNSDGEEVFRLGLQTREQHIRRDKAISNICTNQSLMAVYTAAWTASRGLPYLTERYQQVNRICKNIAVSRTDVLTDPELCTDTIVFRENPFKDTESDGSDCSFEYTQYDDGRVAITLDWSHTQEDLDKLHHELLPKQRDIPSIPLIQSIPSIPSILEGMKGTECMPNFYEDYAGNELKLARYLHKLSEKDITLIDSMIPLGSCTMKYNPMHIFRVFDQDNLLTLHPLSQNMRHVRDSLEPFKHALCCLTGFDRAILSPLSGSHGELVALLAIRAYHRARATGLTGDREEPRIMLLPKSCHGTNAASCSMAGFDIKIIDDINCGSFHQQTLAAIGECTEGSIAGIMVTFPNTLGYFDNDIPETLALVRQHGGLCYLDGANMNSMVGHVDLQEVGFDIGHLNLHKTFAVPHGGGGPGAGPLIFREYLSEYLPNWEGCNRHGVSEFGNTVANFMSWLYLTEMDREQVLNIAVKATDNANHLKRLLRDEFDIVTDKDGAVSHELVIRLGDTDLDATEVCKRLIDFGYHPPTVNWPIPNCLMIEPTETEDIESIEQFANTLIMIKHEGHSKGISMGIPPCNPRYSVRINEVQSDKDALKN